SRAHHDLHSFPTRRSSDLLASSARPIFERPGRLRRLASSYSSCRVFGWVDPVRLRFATAAACLPSAVRVFFGMLAIVRFDFDARSEEHTSELQSLAYLVCR